MFWLFLHRASWRYTSPKVPAVKIITIDCENYLRTIFNCKNFERKITMLAMQATVMGLSSWTGALTFTVTLRCAGTVSATLKSVDLYFLLLLLTKHLDTFSNWNMSHLEQISPPISKIPTLNLVYKDLADFWILFSSLTHPSWKRCLFWGAFCRTQRVPT